MYHPKPYQKCEMPEFSGTLGVLVLNGSLKHKSESSNTEELAELVIENMKSHSEIDYEIIRLADKNIPAGLGFKESEDDEWPKIAEKIKKADIVLFASPIWWGGRSSLMQRIIERMDAFDEEYIHGGRNTLLNKVAGIVITGSEDGAQATLSSLMSMLTFMNFALPPQCAAYWVGEVGQDPKDDRERRLKNKAVENMAKTMARNLVFYAKLLKDHPIIEK
ncbi:NAD(P)H-dependent oxidoreductase [Candidatus Giovannonibacteria bacterium]|nr:NAD(P)H-dependent oxidoreductase [Candidatus Giovannonibacteria bacterium]